MSPGCVFNGVYAAMQGVEWGTNADILGVCIDTRMGAGRGVCSERGFSEPRLGEGKKLGN
jgi:hypothetical protein